MQSLESQECRTKTAILDTAERLFATNGFEATSLRAITAAAAANLGAVNYHFSSKHGLVLAVPQAHVPARQRAAIAPPR